MLKATVSGSFRRHMSAIYEAVTELSELGVDVLSPSDPRVVEQIGEFVFVASDRVRSIRMVEDRHLECIRASDFLWLVSPDGYVGQSASMELGYAIAHGVPIFCQDVPADGTLQKYVQLVPSSSAALPLTHRANGAPSQRSSFLIDPINVIDRAHDRLDYLRAGLTRPVGKLSAGQGNLILSEADELARLFAGPGAHMSSRAF